MQISTLPSPNRVKATIDLPHNRPANLETTAEAHTKPIYLPQSSGCPRTAQGAEASTGELSPFQHQESEKTTEGSAGAGQNTTCRDETSDSRNPALSTSGSPQKTATTTREERHLRRERRPHRGESLEPRRSRYPQWWSCANRPRGGNKIYKSGFLFLGEREEVFRERESLN
ncbi:type II secretion system protein H [Striga asiatica]|uniref:Type II secretion system protein H n=1 Tax=Striga asiatica TaxID=4170 RepID=A0A5A7RA54_STRAF|nr:type II secretion system protein H [Striga asiatica]